MADWKLDYFREKLRGRVQDIIADYLRMDHDDGIDGYAEDATGEVMASMLDEMERQGLKCG